MKERTKKRISLVLNVVFTVGTLVGLLVLINKNNNLVDNIEVLQHNIEVSERNNKVDRTNAKIDVFSDFTNMLVDFEPDTLSNDHKEVLNILIDRTVKYAEDSIKPILDEADSLRNVNDQE